MNMLLLIGAAVLLVFLLLFGIFGALAAKKAPATPSPILVQTTAVVR